MRNKTPRWLSRGRLQGLVYPLLGDFEMTGDRLLWWRPAVSDLPFFSFLECLAFEFVDSRADA